MALPPSCRKGREAVMEEALEIVPLPWPVDLSGRAG